MRTWRTASVFPDSSPLRHIFARERLQKCACFVARVFSSASRFAQANMRTCPVAASCAITGTRPAASKATPSRSVAGSGFSAMDLISHRDTPRAQVFVRLLHGELAEVEDRRREHGLGVPL